MVVDLSTNPATAKRGGETDTLISIEGAIGSDKADTFKGDAQNNEFQGGLGKDSYTGGSGRDTYDFNVVTGSPVGANRDVIKDFVYAYATESKDSTVRFDWTDPDPRPGLSWYYVRVLQTDGQIAWGSPIWVQYPAGK